MPGVSLIRGTLSAWLIAAALVATPPSVAAQTLQQSLFDGRVTIDGRYRFEHVDQDGFARDARAATLRTRLGYETRNFEGFFAFVELENITAIGNEAIEIENAQAFSSRTFGARFAGSRRFRFNRDLSIVYAFEFAHQRDHAANPTDYDERYVLIEPGLIVGDLTARIGFERLGGDGASSFQTPFATLHAFNGVTDRFLVTPAGGLDDRYAKIAYLIEDAAPFEAIAISGAYHDFRSDRGDLDFGAEWSLKAALDLDDRFTLSVEYADFDAGLISTDTRIT